MTKFSKKFSHIYIEKKALNHKNTLKILAKYPKAEIIEINNYKQIFNRRSQSWKSQKKSQNLILGFREDNFLYKGSNVTPNFGYDNFYYNSVVLNCLYDCSYCYLQGMFPSANLVIFVNNEDFINKAIIQSENHNPLYLCISYDSDLLSLEGLLGYCREWITSINDNIIIEIRTKSANFNSLKDLKAKDNVILAWTLSPENIIKEQEPLTASLKARIKGIKDAVKNGWKVRICIDPILCYKDFLKDYLGLIDLLNSEIDLSKINNFSFGLFRMENSQFKKFKTIQSENKLAHYPYVKDKNYLTYDQEAYNEITYAIFEKLNSIGINNELIDFQKIN